MKKDRAALLVSLLLYVFTFMVIMLSSCVTVDKAKQVLEKKGESAKYCAEKYPVKTEYIKGDSVITFDTIYTGGELIIDTVINYSKDTVIITKTIPVTKVVTKTVTIVDTVVKENTAAIKAAKIALDKCDSDKVKLQSKVDYITAKLDKVKKTRSTYFWLLLIAVGLLFRKPIYNLIKTFV